ncbi:MAG: glutamate cyclase domain-containing protein [Halioglobus sp.]
MTEFELSQRIEDLLVERNLRNMKTAQVALTPGYYLRAAQSLMPANGCIIIGTGFPVTDTFETDGPLGAIALYDALKKMGADPWLACAPPLSKVLAEDYQVLELTSRNLPDAQHEAKAALERLQPQAIISIERPGLAEDGCYYNMRGEDISPRCAYFDPFLEQANCPTVAIGDGGNEIGMGNIRAAIATLDINASVTGCDELLVADVSNWGAYGLIAFFELWSDLPLLEEIAPTKILQYLSARGSVDGVTRENTLTEDGLDAEEGASVIEGLRQLIHSTKS